MSIMFSIVHLVLSDYYSTTKWCDIERKGSINDENIHTSRFAGANACATDANLLRLYNKLDWI